LAPCAYADSFTGLASEGFAVLGATTVTNVPTSTISGNVGTYSGITITGFNSSPGVAVSDPQVTGGTVQAGTANAMAAQGNASSAFTTLKGLSGLDLTGLNLGGLNLGAGVYSFSSSAQLTGVLTLNFGGGSNEAIVIDVGSALTTASGSSVVLQGWNPTDSVYWAVGSSATFGSSTSFEGNIIADQSDTLITTATDKCGSVIALNAVVTLGANTISTGCNSATSAIVEGLGPGTIMPVTTVVPELSTFALISCGLLAMGLLALRKSRVSSLI
jgi:type VI secretion system secreted protein VgrG